MTTDTQTLESPSATEYAQGSEEAAIAAFEQRGKAKPEPEQASEPDPENDDAPDEDSPDAEADEADTEQDDDPASELVEVEIDGKTFEVPTEVQKGVLRQADYSRKMNEVSAVEKNAKARIEQADKLIEGAEKFAGALAEVNAAKEQIARFERVDWANLRTTNPAEYAATRADLAAYNSDYEAAVRKAQGIDAELSKGKAELADKDRTAMLENLSKNLKGWGDELGAKITQYALEQGYTARELQGLTDARQVIALDKARKYDALQKDKANLKAKAQDAPKVVKPGSPRRVDQAADALAVFRKLQTPEAAEALFLARAKKR